MKQFVDVKGDYVGIEDMSFSLMWKDGSTEAPLFGDEKTIAAVTEEDLNTHYKKFFVPENIVLCISGNFEKESVTRYIKDLFGNLQGKFSAQKPLLKTTQTEPRYLFQNLRLKPPVSSSATRRTRTDIKTSLLCSCLQTFWEVESVPGCR